MADNTLNSSLKEDEVDKEEFLTWNEIVALNKEAEKNAEALLGGQDDMVCSYPEGYKYRQPLYSCRTCSTQTGEKAGVCYACSVNCHDGHDLVELYTKRKFCCDCGNSKFSEKCKLFEEKDKVNSLNKYGHNFDQLYCVCNKPYPPPEDDEEILEEDMHQCCICEDWYHLPHIFDDDIEEKKLLENLLGSDMEEACDMICRGCATKLPFLMCYKSFAISMTMNKDNLTAPDTSNQQSSVLPEVESEKAYPSCKIEKFKSSGEFLKPHTIYFEGTSWREQLCKCSNCLKLYDDAECGFLLEPEDTMGFYDEKRKENMALKGETSLKLDEDVNMASKVYDIVAKKTNNRDAALQAYMAVDEMTKYVSDFFQNADRNKVVTKEDVQKCFEGLKAKRPRLDLDSSADGAWTA